MIINLGEKKSILGHFMQELRDLHIQKDAMRFRFNMERVGQLMAYEISQKLNYKSIEVQTPLGSSTINVASDKIVLSTILRAGLPLQQGLLDFFDSAHCAFISAYRRYSKDGSFDIHIESISSPNLEGSTLILSDPMLATGASMVMAYKAMLSKGIPVHTHIVAVLASREALVYMKKHLPENVTIWVAAIDEELTVRSYIVPGLGDAGDLAYGAKGDIHL